MASWWAAPRSIPKAGRNLCRPALPRYFPGRMYSFLLILLTLDALILTTAVLLQAGPGRGAAAARGGARTRPVIGGRAGATLLPREAPLGAGVLPLLSPGPPLPSAPPLAPRPRPRG